VFEGFAILFGVCIAAVQLLPTATYLLQSQRASEIDYEFALINSFWPWRLIGFIAPNFFGSPVTGDFWGYATFWEDAIYMGLLPFLLAAGSLIKGVFGKGNPVEEQGKFKTAFLSRPLAVFLLILFVVSFLLALGKNTIIYPWLYENVPTFDMFKSPTRFTIWAILSLALLAGFGVDRWRRPTGRGLYWTRLSVAGAVAVTLGAGLGYFILRNDPDFRATFIPATALAGFWGVGVGVLALLAPEKEDLDARNQKIWQYGVIFWVILDLLVAGWGLNPGIELDFYTHIPPNEQTLKTQVGQGRLYLLSEDEHSLTFDRFFQFETFEMRNDWYDLRATFLPNLSNISEIYTVNNYDPLLSGRYNRWITELAAIDDIHSRNDLLDLMAVSVVQTEDASSEFGVHYEPRTSMARVNWVPCVKLVADEETAWEMTFSGGIDFSKFVIVEGGPQLMAFSECDDEMFGTAEIFNEQPNQFDVLVESQSTGWLVISDLWYPGWVAEIDGNQTPVHRANYLFRAVEVPEGTQIVSLSYQPIWFSIGLALSSLAWVLLGILLIWRARGISNKNH
jgi:hypothetical protein